MVRMAPANRQPMPPEKLSIYWGSATVPTEISRNDDLEAMKKSILKTAAHNLKFKSGDVESYLCQDVWIGKQISDLGDLWDKLVAFAKEGKDSHFWSADQRKCKVTAVKAHAKEAVVSTAKRPRSNPIKSLEVRPWNLLRVTTSRPSSAWLFSSKVRTLRF